ncbi:ABC transporter C family member 3 [Euphorbia peplus]|nr:ABC transporter C family member 3 [Euphorbia peplus]
MGFFKNKNKDSILLEKPLLTCSTGSDTLTPYSNASFFSILTFSWMSPIIAIGNKKTLDLDDVPQLYSEDTAAVMFPVFRSNLDDSSVTTFKLAKALIVSFWKEILWTGLFSLLYTSASYVGPYLIDSFIRCLNGRGEFVNEGYLLVFTFFVAKLVECLSLRHWLFRLQQTGIRVRAVLVATIYNKGLMLSPLSRQGHTSGEIINYMAVDAERIGSFSWYIHDLWLVFFQVGFALLILYKNLGLASLAAFVATVLVMLLNYPLGRIQETFQEKMMEWKDKRMKTMSEILRNMRILKLQGWEMKFLSRIVDLRKMEEKWLKTYLYASAMTNFFYWVAPTFVSVITFGACYLMGITLESGNILSALATFRILQAPIYNLPDTVSMLVQTKVSLDRIASFLCLEELQSDVVERLPRFSSGTAIEIVNGIFSWDLHSSTPTLKDINLKVFHGMRVAICGTVGSGKSSLLSCVLGEISKIS